MSRAAPDLEAGRELELVPPYLLFAHHLIPGLAEHDREIVGPARIGEAGRELRSAKGQQERALLNQRELERPLGGFFIDLDLPRRGRLLWAVSRRSGASMLSGPCRSPVVVDCCSGVAREGRATEGLPDAFIGYHRLRRRLRAGRTPD